MIQPKIPALLSYKLPQRLILTAACLSLFQFLVPSPINAGQTSGYVYWTINEVGEIWRIPVENPVAERLVSPDLLHAHAADFTNQKLYYNFGDHLLRTNLDGSERLVIASGVGESRRIRIDPAGKIYWSERDHGRIRRADFDGANLETILSGLSGSLNGIALDPDDGKIYFVDGVDLKRANLDGTSMETLVTVGGLTNGLAVDSANDKIYLTDGATNIGIRWCDLDGSNLEALANGVSLRDIQILDGKAYFLKGSGDVFLHVMDLGGGNEQQVTSGTTLGLDFSLDLDQERVYGGNNVLQSLDYDGSNQVPIIGDFNDSVHDLAIDPGTERFFWTDFGTRAVHAASIEDSLGELVHANRDALHEVRGIALDSVGEYLFWAKTRTAGGIWRTDLDGRNLTEIVPGLTKPHDVAVDEAGGRIYWTDTIDDGNGSSTGAIRSAQTDGSNLVDVHVGLSQSIRGLTLDPVGGKIYWTVQSSGEIVRSDLNGSNLEMILIGLDTPHDVAVDPVDGKLYWTEGISNNDDPTGKIRRADLDGSNPEDVLTGLSDLIRDLIFVRHRTLPLFASGFENGKTSNWSATVP